MVGEKKVLKREKIIATAVNMLKGKGYNEIRVEDITKELKMAKSMFFYYFDSKAVLYLEILYRLHEKLTSSFVEKIEAADISTCDDFKNLIMQMTDEYIKEYFLLIKLLDYEELIYSECMRQQVSDVRDRISKLYDNVHNKVLEKFTFFSRTEIFYIFEVQLHFLRGYYRQMIGNAKYFTGDRKDLDFERKSLYEFRVVRMLRYLIAGMIHEKNLQNMS